MGGSCILQEYYSENERNPIYQTLRSGKDMTQGQFLSGV